MPGSMTQLTNVHEDMVHDVVLDYYGRRLATCSSDKTVKVWEVQAQSNRLLQTLHGHAGPVWQLSWAHPKFGGMLASGSYDGKVIVWTERSANNFQTHTSHAHHHASVNSVEWAPMECGPVLATGSSDGKVSVLELRPDGSWDTKMFNAHVVGVNAVSWAPAIQPPSQPGQPPHPRRLCTGGNDNLVKLWSWKEDQQEYTEDTVLAGHTDWVRDASWAPSILKRSYIASASQDKTVIIWSADSPEGPWNKKVIEFDAPCWRVSWSLSGHILAVSSADNKVSLWKETLKGDWEKVKDVEE